MALLPAASVDLLPVDLDAVVSLTGDVSHHGVPCLRLTDSVGAPLTRSKVVADAVLRNAPAVEVHLRDELGGVLAVGTVSARRTVAATCEQMIMVAGPLIVIAARRLPLPAPGVPSPFLPETGDVRRAVKLANAAGTARFLGRIANRVTSVVDWKVAAVPGPAPLDDLIARGGRPSRPLRWCAAPTLGFWADPFVLRDNGTTWLLVEELDYATGLGAIRLLEVVGDDVVPHQILLRTDHHLSFPQVYRSAGRWLATVETCARHNPIYTFDRLGDPWRPADLPALPPHLADPVLTFDGDGAVTGVLGTDAQVNGDTVVVDFTLDAATGTWVRRDDAVRVSVFNGRGGGTLDPFRNLRATQDCAGVYGRAVEVTRIDQQDPADVVLRIEGGTVGRDARGRATVGLHTLTWTPDGEHAWLDGWRRRRTPLGWLWDIKERQHLDSCHG